jgi:hypothetical protein
LEETLQAHASGVSQLAMGATDPPLLLSAASDARVSIWSPSTWRPVNDFGGDDPYVFGGEEAWMGPRVTRAMVYTSPGSVRGLVTQWHISLVAHLQAVPTQAESGGALNQLAPVLRSIAG